VIAVEANEVSLHKNYSRVHRMDALSRKWPIFILSGAPTGHVRLLAPAAAGAHVAVGPALA
jgi:hypothetical protein